MSTEEEFDSEDWFSSTLLSDSILIVSSSTIDKMFEIYTLYKKIRFEICTFSKLNLCIFFEDRFEIDILFENGFEIAFTFCLNIGSKTDSKFWMLDELTMRVNLFTVCDKQ